MWDLRRTFHMLIDIVAKTDDIGLVLYDSEVKHSAVPWLLFPIVDEIVRRGFSFGSAVQPGSKGLPDNNHLSVHSVCSARLQHGIFFSLPRFSFSFFEIK